MKNLCAEAFANHAQTGIDLFMKEKPDFPAPVPSHICFKFTSVETYNAHVCAAGTLGTVTKQVFKGKEIAWCRLAEPLRQGNLAIEWLELVEPKEESNGFDGVTSIGYSVSGLDGVVKIPAGGGSPVVFRYQSHHASALAGS